LDVKYLPQKLNETCGTYLFAAIDQATLWAFVAIKKDKTATSAHCFSSVMHKACPFKIATLLTDNDQEFLGGLLAARSASPVEILNLTGCATT